MMSNVPKLRFKEFSGEWKKQKLNQIASKSNSKNKDESICEVFTNSAVNGIVAQRDFFDKDIANQNNLAGYYIVRHNDFIYNPRISTSAPVGPLNRNHLQTGVMSPLYTVFTVKDTSVSLEYLERYFKSSKWFKYMYSIANYGARSDRMSVTNNDFFAMPIPIPSKPEQEKIASFLTSVDTKIELLVRKEELLQQYKKGVMQKIFSQEIRFKADDGSKYPEWEEKGGNKIFETITNKNHNSDLPVLAITQEYGAIPRDMIDYQISVTDKSVATYKVVEIGDFIISLRSFQGGIEYSNYKGICSPAYIILRPYIDVDTRFYKLYLKTDNYIKQLNRNIEGIRDGKMISYKQFSDIKLPYPCIEEQTKIANFLSSIDSKLEHIQKQLNATKAFKKALLQQMFV